MRVVVVGAGAWGLPTAAELARRGHVVTLVDGLGYGHSLGSSSGPSRLWRLSHPDRRRVRLAQRAVQAWERLEARGGQSLLLRRGLLWRGASAEAVATALTAEGVASTWVDPADVGRFFPGLLATAEAACWQTDAGPVLAEAALSVSRALFECAGGTAVLGRWVTEVVPTSDGVAVGFADGDHLAADAAVVAAGPWTADLLRSLCVDLELVPVLEQVVYVDGSSGWLDLPCVFDGPVGDQPGLYAMPTQGWGYKVGLDRALRGFSAADVNREPDPTITAEIVSRVARDFGALRSTVQSAQVCTWTDSPDGHFVIDVAHAGRVVLACGDSGEGFKFAALMGELLADRVEGRTPDADVAWFGLARLANRPLGAARSVLGGT